MGLAFNGGQPTAFLAAGQGLECSTRCHPGCFCQSNPAISARQGGDAVLSLGISFPTPSLGPHSDRLLQPLCDSYSPTLPLFCLAGATPLNWQSEVPNLDRHYCKCLAVASMCLHGLSTSPRRDFPGKIFQKRSGTSNHTSQAQQIRSVTLSETRPRGTRVTRLSYPATLMGCPIRCQHIQVSPQCPATFLQPQQPSCSAFVRLFRAARREG